MPRLVLDIVFPIVSAAVIYVALVRLHASRVVGFVLLFAAVLISAVAISGLANLLTVVLCCAAVIVGLSLQVWDRIVRAMDAARPHVGPVRSDAYAVALELEQAGFAPSAAGWLELPDVNWNTLGMARPDGTFATIVSGERAPGIGLATEFTNGMSLYTTRRSHVPVGPSVVRQSFPDSDITALVHQHDASLAAVVGRGLTVAPQDTNTVDRARLARERRSFAYLRAHPIGSVFGTIWRQLTKHHLDDGSVLSRPGALQRLVASHP